MSQRHEKLCLKEAYWPESENFWKWKKSLAYYFQLIWLSLTLDCDLAQVLNGLMSVLSHFVVDWPLRKGTNMDKLKNWYKRFLSEKAICALSPCHLVTSWKKCFNSQKTGLNLIPSKIVPIEWVDLNPKIKFAICHWSWELGSM